MTTCHAVLQGGFPHPTKATHTTPLQDPCIKHTPNDGHAVLQPRQASKVHRLQALPKALVRHCRSRQRAVRSPTYDAYRRSMHPEHPTLQGTNAAQPGATEAGQACSPTAGLRAAAAAHSVACLAALPATATKVHVGANRVLPVSRAMSHSTPMASTRATYLVSLPRRLTLTWVWWSTLHTAGTAGAQA